MKEKKQRREKGDERNWPCGWVLKAEAVEVSVGLGRKNWIMFLCFIGFQLGLIAPCLLALIPKCFFLRS